MTLQDSKYLTLVLGEENYAIPILKIKEMIGMMSITKAPRFPDFIEGVINLRDNIVPLIDLRLKFGFPKRKYDERTSIIIVELETQNGKKTSGIIVDSVQEVITISTDTIEAPPKCGPNVDWGFLLGMGKVDDKVIMLLNVDEILSPAQKKELDDIN